MAYAALRSVPLCTDLDDTLIRTDLLFESLAGLLKQKPWLLLLVPFWCLKGGAALKRSLARQVSIDVASLPYNTPLVEWLRSQKAAKRQLMLVTAADESLANQVADHLGLFDRVIASDGRLNVKGRQKLKVLRQQVPGEFDYAGDAWIDLEIWRHSSNAITVGVSSSLLRRVREHAMHVTTFGGRSAHLRDYLAVLRVHQWAKNVLIFVPLIASHQFMHPALLVRSALSFLFFGFCSSAQYILSDLINLEADRHHATRRRRPFASGDIPLAMGFVLAPILLTVSLAGALFLSKSLAAALLAYFILSLSYSLYLGRVPLLGPFVLSGLYTLRIIAGHLVTGVAFSVWLPSFAFWAG